MWADSLSCAEAEFTNSAIEALGSVPWAQPILHRLREAGGVAAKNKPLLFEIRVAYELHRAGRTATYEFAAGVGNSTVDFCVHGSPEWLIETVSIGESNAVKDGTVDDGLISRVALVSFFDDRKNSEEGELLLLQQKIGEKAFRSGKPAKFPLPEARIHLILADTRGFNIGASDRYDYDHAAQGAVVLPDPVYVRFWNNQPIRGLFERANPLQSSSFVQERIHFIGFVKESEYCEGEIPRLAYLTPNPHLFSFDGNAVAGAYESFPLKTAASRAA